MARQIESVELTNREIAVLAWLMGFGLWVLTMSGVRHSLLGVLRAVAHPKLAIPLVLFLGYFGLAVAAGAAVGVWRVSLLTDTVAWFTVAGLVTFGRFSEVGQPRFMRDTLLATIAIPEIVQFVFGTVTFSLIVELAIIPIAFMLGGLAVVVERMPEHRSARPVVGSLSATFGLALLGGTTVQLVTTWSSLDYRELILSFYLPIWLTVASIPFVFGLAVYSAYEQAFTTLDFCNAERRPVSVRAKLAVVLGFRLRLNAVRQFAWSKRQELYRARSFGEARGVVQSFKDDQ